MLRRTDAFLIASMSAAIASSISLFGLLLASMGIYSTVSYDVVLRTREVGHPDGDRRSEAPRPGA